MGRLAVVRLAETNENAIADLAEEASAWLAKADILEREIANDAEALLDQLIEGDLSQFIVNGPHVEVETGGTISRP
jgi:hypothetical protein